MTERIRELKRIERLFADINIIYDGSYSNKARSGAEQDVVVAKAIVELLNNDDVKAAAFTDWKLGLVKGYSAVSSYKQRVGLYGYLLRVAEKNLRGARAPNRNEIRSVSTKLLRLADRFIHSFEDSLDSPMTEQQAANALQALEKTIERF